MEKTQALSILLNEGFDFTKDFHTLNTDQKLRLRELMRACKYTYKAASGASTALSFWQSLSRLDHRNKVGAEQN